MRFGLRSWLAVALAALAAVTATVAVYAVSSRTDARFRRNAESLAVGNAVATAETLRASTGGASLRRHLVRAAAAHHSRVFLLDAGGHLIAAAGRPSVAFADVPGSVDAAKAALAGDRAIHSGSDGVVVIGLDVGDTSRHVIVVVARVPELRQALGVVHDAVLRAAIWATLLGAAVGLVIATLIGRRLGRIAAVAKAITDGDLTHPARSGFPDEIGSLAESIESMRQRLAERDQIERAQRDFATNAAHELRTPVAAITSSVEMLQTGAKDDPVARDQFIAAIDEQSRRLGRLTRALLTLARAQAGQEEPRRDRVALLPLLRRVADETSTHAGVELAVEGDDTSAFVDADLLEQAVSAVVGNAARYTASGRILLRADAVNGRAAITIADTGPGLTASQQEHAFDRFYRGEAGRDGFGLGLSIAQQATEAMGGALDLSSSEGSGTTVRFVLPSRSGQ